MRKLLFLLVVVAFFGTGAVSAQVWDLTNDFTPYSGGPNPNGEWSYGYLEAGTLAYTQFDYFETMTHMGADVGGWHPSGAGNWDSMGNVWKNYGPVSFDDWGSHREAGKMGCGAGGLGGETTARWTCPASNDYLVTVRFTGQRHVGSTAECRVRLNGNEIFSDQLDGFIGRSANNYEDGFGDTRELNWSGPLSLAAGDIIDTTWRADIIASQCTGVEVTISSAGALPEPNLILHLQADAGILDEGGSPASVGETVGTWVDQSNYGYDFIKNWGTPTLQTGSFAAPAGDKPVIRFVSADGSSGDGLVLDNSDPNAINPVNFTLFVVGKINSSPQQSRTFFGNYSDSGGGMIAGISESALFPDLAGFNTNGSELTSNEECPLDTSKYYLLTCVRHFAQGKRLFLNSNLEAAGGGSVTYDEDKIASVGALDIGRQFLDGDIAEIMLFDGWEPNMVRETESYLIGKYALDPTPCISDPNRIILTAVTYYGTTADGTVRTEERSNTLWEDLAWDLALYDSPITPDPGADLLNYLPGMNLYVPLHLNDGPRTFSFLVAVGPGGGMSPDRYAGVSLYFDQSELDNEPGISVFGQVDPNLPGQVPDPDYYANSAELTMGWPIDPSVPGAGTLRYVDTEKGITVALTDYVTYAESAYNLDYLRAQFLPDDANSYHPIVDDGGPDGISDIVGEFTLQVEKANCQDLDDYFAMDFNKDCRVGLADFAFFVQEWLKCNDPLDPTCTDVVPEP